MNHVCVFHLFLKNLMIKLSDWIISLFFQKKTYMTWILPFKKTSKWLEFSRFLSCFFKWLITHCMYCNRAPNAHNIYKLRIRNYLEFWNVRVGCKIKMFFASCKYCNCFFTNISTTSTSAIEFYKLLLCTFFFSEMICWRICVNYSYAFFITYI